MQTAPALTGSEPAPGPRDLPPDEVPFDNRNFWAWVAYQFFYRIGWQFKMESTLMAGIISYLTPDPRLMGLFTTLNNVGRNLAPLVAAPLVDRFARKRRALMLFWIATVAVWAGLTLYLWLPVSANRALSIWVFGACYTLFFVLLGAATVAQGALLGKVIPANMRGRAMAVGMTISGGINVCAILLIYQVIRSGRFPEPRNYALSFTLTTGFFAVAALSLLFIREEPSEVARRSFHPGESFKTFIKLGRENPNLARLLLVNISVGICGSMLQFYTGYARRSGILTESFVVLATVFQVFWQSLSCSIFGRIADRRGNRAVIIWMLWIEAIVPLSALVLGGWEPFRSQWIWYLGVYTLVGLRFPLYQLLVNYLLEVVPQREHAMAIGATTTVQLVTAAAPILLGTVASVWGYPAAFVVASGVGFYGAVTALSMEEVRPGLA